MTYTAIDPGGRHHGAARRRPGRRDHRLRGRPTTPPATFTGKIALIKRGGCTFATKQAARRGGRRGRRGHLQQHRGRPRRHPRRPGARARSRPAASPRRRARRSPPTSPAATVTVAFEVRAAPGEPHDPQRHRGDPRRQRGQHRVARRPPRLGHRRAPASTTTAPARPASSRWPRSSPSSKSKPTNKVRFAWWSAEEFGLLGSEAYVAGLTDEAARADQALPELRHDRLAERRPLRLRRRRLGRGRRGPRPGGLGPAGEGHQRVPGQPRATRTRARTSPAARTTARSSRWASPPAVPSPAPRASRPRPRPRKFGGKAGVAYDACYHAACDDLSNINMKALRHQHRRHRQRGGPRTPTTWRSLTQAGHAGPEHRRAGQRRRPARGPRHEVTE